MAKQRPLTQDEIVTLIFLAWLFWPSIKRFVAWCDRTIPKILYGIGWLYGRYIAAVTHQGYDKYLKGD